MLRYLKRISWLLLIGNYELKICYLGVLYHRWKKYDKAEQLYQKALEINPKLQSAKDNMVLHITILASTILKLPTGKMCFPNICYDSNLVDPGAREWCRYGLYQIYDFL